MSLTQHQEDELRERVRQQIDMSRELGSYVVMSLIAAAAVFVAAIRLVFTINEPVTYRDLIIVPLYFMLNYAVKNLRAKQLATREHIRETLDMFDKFDDIPLDYYKKIIQEESRK